VINVGLIRRPKFTWKDYIIKASPPLGERREEEKSLSVVAIKVRVLGLLSHRELELATP